MAVAIHPTHSKATLALRWRNYMLQLLGRSDCRFDLCINKEIKTRKSQIITKHISVFELSL